jgi:hypothetical protein
MIFNFLSLRVNTSKKPDCPRCSRSELERRASLFSVSKGLEENSDDGMPDIDESKMERALAMMEGQVDKIDEDDPRQAAKFMRQLSDVAGLKWGSGMEEAMARLEAGEDPEQIEEDLGDVLENEDLLTTSKRLLRKSKEPIKDETIYDLD